MRKLSELFQIFRVVYVLLCLFLAGAGMVRTLVTLLKEKKKTLTNDKYNYYNNEL